MVDKVQNSEEIFIEINGQKCAAKPGMSVIQVADDHQIHIPRFCYHKKLSVAANCRMCLVDIEGARKPSPACATPIMKDMKVYTKSAKTIAYQKAVMEFLLINHPLDCPICDQGGECELQDVALGYGKDTSRFTEGKRVTPDLELGPLIATDLTRCIQCTRCVRFSQEIAGVQELGLMDRGDHAKISTYIDKTIQSELSGNMIDVCPVGALTSKPYRYRARPWELKQVPMISPHDAVGSHLYTHIRRNQILRVSPRENAALNEVWLSDRDRFAYEGIYADNRIHMPLIKKNNQWVEVSWEEALNQVSAAIQSVTEQSPEYLGAILSDNSTNEEAYLMQKFMRTLNTPHIDSRIKLMNTPHPVHYAQGLNIPIADIPKADYILILGSHLRKEQPIINLKVKQASDKGAHVESFACRQLEYNYPIQQHLIGADDLLLILAALYKQLNHKTNTADSTSSLSQLLEDVTPSANIVRIAQCLLAAKKPIVMLGQDAILNRDFAGIYAFLNLILKLPLPSSTIAGGILGFGSNAAGTVKMGAVPYKSTGTPSGANVAQMLNGEQKLKALFLMNVDPYEDVVASCQQTKVTLQKIDFVIALNSHLTPALKETADIILPMSTPYETEGTYLNFNQKAQHFKPCTLSNTPTNQAKQAWKILRVIANYCALPGFEHTTIEAVRAEIENLPTMTYADHPEMFLPNQLRTQQNTLRLQPTLSPYRQDMVTRHAKSLNNTEDAIQSQKIICSAHMTYSTAELKQHLNLFEHEYIESNVHPKTILIPLALYNTLPFGKVDVTFDINDTCDTHDTYDTNNVSTEDSK